MKLIAIGFLFVGALLAGCGGQTESKSAAPDASDYVPGASENGCAPANNPEGCPSHYSFSENFGACVEGTECKYPGYSDEGASCNDYAELDCIASATDGGAPGWRASQ